MSCNLIDDCLIKVTSKIERVRSMAASSSFVRVWVVELYATRHVIAGLIRNPEGQGWADNKTTPTSNFPSPSD